MNIEGLFAILKRLGCRNVYLKILSPNDNSKNQIYLGGDFSALNIFPVLSINPDTTGSYKKPIFKAGLSFYWINNFEKIAIAPSAQLILYPQYPEVRFSGFLKGCEFAPSELMSSRQEGRLLVLGIHDDGRVFGYVYAPSESLLIDVKKKYSCTSQGVFYHLNLYQEGDGKRKLLEELYCIYEKGWIDSKRLLPTGVIGPCEAPQCGGYTLEAELGIRTNGLKEPDFLGWEVKQYNVSNFKNISAGVITLITPEPDGGIYKTEGVLPFVRRYGYKDKLGREDRINFGSIHGCGQNNTNTNLRMAIDGFDLSNNKITKSDGGIFLLDKFDNAAAIWSFSGLMEHWNRKHAHTAFIPSLSRKLPCLQYHYGNQIRLGEYSDFFKFLTALSNGIIYYDPGIKIENESTKPKAKKRSQFRIKSKDVCGLYKTFETVDLEKIPLS
jgi:hypothetical protein